MKKKFFAFVIKYVKIALTAGVIVSVKLCILDLLLKFFKSQHLISFKHKTLQKYFDEKYSYLINKDYNKEKEDILFFNKEACTIWICWWQGEEKMPEIIKICFESVKRNNKGQHPIILITENNYTEFVNLPIFIEQKFREGIISITHFSDIIRTCLLYNYGGLWMDATIFMSQSFSEEIFDSNFYTIKLRRAYTQSITNYQWASFFLYSIPKSVLFENQLKLLYEYWLREDCVIDYLFFDYLIDILKRNRKDIFDTIESIPFNNQHVYSLYNVLNKEFDMNYYSEITNDTYLFKLSYKDPSKFLLSKENNKLTYFSFIKQLL